MTSVQSLVSDLRDNRLWPFAVLLVVALIAVPALLYSPAKSVPLSRAPAATPAPVGGTSGMPVLSVDSTPAPSHARLSGRGRDPFTQRPLPVSAPAATGGVSSPRAAASASAGPAASSSAGSAQTATPSTSGATSGASAAPTQPQITYFTYATTVVIHRLGGRTRTITDLPRLQALPSSANPFLVFLGVRGDHKTAVFLVSSRAVGAGDGKCRPNARSCQLMDLQIGKTELFQFHGASGAVAQYTLAVQDIRVKTVSNPKAAHTAHARESHSGRVIVGRARPLSIGLQGLSYSADSGLLYSHPVSKVWLAHVRKQHGQIPSGVVLQPAVDGNASNLATLILRIG